jgi:hypothetical protein
VGVFDFLRRRRPEDQFARRVMRRLHQLGWSRSIRYDPDAFAIVVDGDAGQLFLGNIYRDWETYPRHERAAQLDRAIAFMFEEDEDKTLEEVADRLVPVIRNLRDLQALALESESDPSPEIWQPHRVLVDPLGVVLAIDRPHSIALVQASKLERWGCSFDTALDRAMANLISKSPVRFKRMREGFYVSDYGDAHDSSRLLMPELFRALQLKGEPIAVVISRSCVAVAGSEERGALHAMQAFVVRQLPQETRPTSFLPLMLRDGEWRAIDPYSHQLDAVRDLAIKGAIWDYRPQTRVLEAFFERRGEDIFVAPLEFVTFRGDAHTWTSWTEHVPALLPYSEALGLTAADGRKLFRLWRDIEAVCGPFTPDTAFHPVRYKSSLWPSPEAWGRLEAEFEPPEWILADSELAQ